MSQPQTHASESGERGKTMKIDILKEYAALEAMETKELLQVWNRHFDAPPQSRNNRTRQGRDDLGITLCACHVIWIAYCVIH